ncbi:hypothetical protein HSR121_3066 [Halapricum desulfuricans]|uniref:Uncharacterized protein n=1 Tax=Halapricum desulfuricans TaxID=2841257 RepID=A0A897NAF6_9EURY|nr:hypothetical protein HSR121_3066 [Halapricum desulfuricans]
MKPWVRQLTVLIVSRATTPSISRPRAEAINDRAVSCGVTRQRRPAVRRS